MSIKEQMEQIYRDIALQDIPWNNQAAPETLVGAVTSLAAPRSTVIELGCGAGNSVLALSRLGFDVTGVDIAENAIAIAQAAARKARLACRFVAADVLGDLGALTGPFDLAYDWELLHHIFPEDREQYVGNVWRLLDAGGWYLSVCFAEDDPQFGGVGKYRTTRLGTTLYFSSEQEIASLLAPRFVVAELRTIDIRAKHDSHRAIYASARRRGG